MDPEEIKILLIDDAPGRMLSDLAEAGSKNRETVFRTDQAATLDQGIALAAGREYDIILVSLFLPDSMGAKTLLRLFRADHNLPVIVLCSGIDETAAHQSIQLGAQDYLFKEEVSPRLLKQTILHAIERHLLYREMKETTEQLRISQQNYRDIIMNDRDGIVIADDEGVICFVNPAAEAIFGREQGALLGELFGFPMTNGGITEICIIPNRDNASAVVVAEMLVAETYWEDRPACLASLRDITNRKEAEKGIRQAKEQWERTFDSISDIVTIQDTNLRILKANRATYEQLKIGRDEVIGRHCYEVFRNSDKPCDHCPEVRLLKDHLPQFAEIDHPNLGKTYQVSSSPIIDDQGKLGAIVHFAKDITEQKQLEEQFLQAQKVQAVGALAGGIAHDFNNILQGIIGFSELTRQILADRPELCQDIEEIIALGKRGASLTRQLLAFSRKEKIESVPLSLNQHINNLLKILNHLLGEHIQLSFLEMPEIAQVMADPGQLEQIIINLVVNARDAMKNGGRIRIKTAQVKLDDRDAGPDSPPGDYVLLEITDNGCGMDRQTCARIFDPFFTTKGVGKGTGLGLATVRSIIQQHQGYIQVTSEPGQGATFRIYLPAMPSKTTANQADPTTTQDTPQGKETILLVEDNPNVRELVDRILKKYGYQVLMTADVDEAEQMLAEAKEKIDLLLTDVIMPKRNGRDLYLRLAAEKPTLKVLYMSGYTDDIIGEIDLESDGARLIRKPFTPAELGSRLREMLT